MKMIRLKISALAESRWYEHGIRFVLGGLATLLMGMISKLAGPAWGGLLLAFPAVFCASSTLIERHERRRKEEKHLLGRNRGKEAAALDAFGMAIGSFGMTAFAMTILATAELSPILALSLAPIAWSLTAASAWYLGKIVHFNLLRQRSRREIP